MKQMEPHLYKCTTENEWNHQKISKCIEKGSRECNPHSGDITDTQLAYFCGQGIECVEWNNPNSIKRAKSNVEKYFPVVAVLEHLTQTFYVMEKVLPKYFNNAAETFKLSKPLPACHLIHTGYFETA